VRAAAETVDLVELGATPILLVSDSGQFVSASTFCSSGTVTGTLNGAPLPAAGTPAPLSGVLAATFASCRESGHPYTYNGTGSLNYRFDSLANIDVAVKGEATAQLTAMRLLEAGTTRDITGNGSVVLSFNDTAVGATVTNEFTVTPGSGTTLLNATRGVTATYASGSLLLRFVTQGTAVTSERYAATQLTYSIGGVPYVANGTIDVTYNAQGAFTGTSGQIVVTSGGAPIGRLIASSTTGALVIDINGQLTPLAGQRVRPTLVLHR
jgi:hypothetical protein